MVGRNLLMPVLAACCVLAFSGCPVDAPPPHNPFGTDDTVTIASIEQRIFTLINREREAHDVPAVARTAALGAVARAHSEDMAAHNYFHHTNLDGQMSFDRLDAAEIEWMAAGEIIAHSSNQTDPAAQAVSLWRNSPDHRAIMLDDHYTRTGIGVARSEAGMYFFTQIFIER